MLRLLNKILNNDSNSVALDGNPEPEPDLVHATGCKQPSLKFHTLTESEHSPNHYLLSGYLRSVAYAVIIRL
jgi:hypothetical protein